MTSMLLSVVQEEEEEEEDEDMVSLSPGFRSLNPAIINL